MKKIIFIAIAFLIFLPASDSKAADVSVNFYVDQNYDANERQNLQATLVKTTPSLYFYVEENWWKAQSDPSKSEILSGFNSLSDEFASKIRPTLISILGSEWNPGIDGDGKITVLFHNIEASATGYFRTADEYSKLQAPSSNQREMVYLSTAQIVSPHLKEFLAHEFTHLIIFNQKDRMFGVAEETWLNEAIADYSITILGYNDVYQDSNLQRRVGDFLQKTDDSLTEWQNTKYDYALVNLLTHYLVDHYGYGILRNSLASSLTGIDALDRALLQNGAQENFAQIFTNWTIAIVVNDCSLGAKYCYLNNNLVNVRINPALIFLPVSGNTSLSITNFTKYWSGNWQKVVGGSGDLKLQFSSQATLDFKVPYMLVDKNNNYLIASLLLDKNNAGQISIEDFSNKYNSLIIIPSLQGKTAGFNGLEISHPFDIAISALAKGPQEDEAVIQELLAQIDSLKKQIAALQPGIDPESQCALSADLYYGVFNSSQVRCLQQFLTAQGADIYPQGLVTGYFGNLTRLAVTRFQEKHRNEILTPVGLSKGTGFVGMLTRAKINQLLK